METLGLGLGFPVKFFALKLRKDLLTFRVKIAKNFDVFCSDAQKPFPKNSEENLGICVFRYFLLFCDFELFRYFVKF